MSSGEKPFQYQQFADFSKLLQSSTLQKIPTPQYVVFYNGLKDEPDRQVLKLSDSFMLRKHAVNKKLSLGDAITLAIDECLENGILSDILTEERAEVLATYLELIKDDMISVKEAASRLEISEEKIKELLKK